MGSFFFKENAWKAHTRGHSKYQHALSPSPDLLEGNEHVARGLLSGCRWVRQGFAGSLPRHWQQEGFLDLKEALSALGFPVDATG